MNFVGYIVVGYLVVGALVIGNIAPAYLKRRGINVSDPRSDDPWVRAFEGPPGSLVLVSVLFWPIVAPIWIWSEISVRSEREKFQKSELERQKLRKMNKYLDLSMEEKLVALQKLVESNKDRSNKAIE